jgi:protein-disulfide isomerase
MIPRPISGALDWLTTRKGAGLTGATVIAVALLIAVADGRNRPATAPSSTPAPASAEVLKSAEGAGFTPSQVQAVRDIIKDYLVKNPEIMVEVSRELESRQQSLQAAEHKRLIVQHKAQIFAAPTDFVLGNPKGDITVVEFFDYNCGWCKRAVDDVMKLAKADPSIRIVMKEFPIFGEHSTFAAKAAMAANRQGKYWDFHVAMMREKQVTKDSVLAIAGRVGLDVAKLQADMADPKFEAALNDTHQIAQSLSIEGTPGFIIDTKVNVGYLPVDGLQKLVGETRKNGCQVC